jgi:synaptojanin
MDLGKGAYVIYDQTYEAEWTDAIVHVLGDHYEKISSHQLIGLFLIVFANKAIVPAISAVRNAHLATGHFAILGNKGCTGVRLQCYDSTICFINVHLYHVAEATVRRTGDLERILNDLVFEDYEDIKAHDLVFLFGDLNYRVLALGTPLT